MVEIELGRAYRDRVTGYAGVAVGVSDRLDGTKTVDLQAPALASGKVPLPVWFSVDRVDPVPAVPVTGDLGI